jgi:Ras-related protein Rab-5C
MSATRASAGTASPKKYKVVLLGESGVGKSSLVVRLVKNEYVPTQHSTVGASFFRYAANVDEQTINFDIWDTAGQERYKSLASMYYRGAAAALVVYDITAADSFKRARFWISELVANSPDTVIALVGNKCDREDERAVTKEEARALAAEMSNLVYFEASAKDGTRVQAVFHVVARKLATATAAAAASGTPGKPGAGGGGRAVNVANGGAKQDGKKDCKC